MHMDISLRHEVCGAWLRAFAPMGQELLFLVIGAKNKFELTCTTTEVRAGSS